MSDVVIGLEVHCQLDTRTKLFCSCSTDYRDDGPNTHVCPVCLGLPGTLPAVNRAAIEYALKVAKAFHCEIPDECEFSRKNYFYPDLPKGFQITQYDRPLALGGYIEIESEEGGEKRVRLTRIHLEEDPGRLVHKGGGDRTRYSLVDYNRSGVPLIEIVTEPDLSSPKEARRLLAQLRATLEYLGVYDSEKEGSLRVDANVSIRGHERAEVKNISSYKGVEKALTFEITRQRSLIRRGATIERETRHFVEARGTTTSSRSKVEEHDYRYFPEPDLPPLRVAGWVDAIELPELPAARRDRFVAQYATSPIHAKTLTGDPRIADFFETVAGVPSMTAPATASWVADTLLGELNYRDRTVATVYPAIFSSLLDLVDAGTITDRSGVDVLRIVLDSGEEPGAVVERLGLAATRSDDAIAAAIAEAIVEHPQAVADFRAGKANAINYLAGQVMKKTRGRADPKELGRLLAAALEE
jgi:aspartyl-tRNA(Asn)/glutamyl-tRNA(Gln) amidotransferase subunit B